MAVIAKKHLKRRRYEELVVEKRSRKEIVIDQLFSEWGSIMLERYLREPRVLGHKCKKYTIIRKKFKK